MARLLCVFLFALFAASPAYAWGKTGHRVTGAIAERYLSDAARAAIEEIIGPEDAAESAPWADFMRSSPDPFWRDQSSPLHYATVPAGRTYAEIGAPPEGDAVTALEGFKRILRDPAASRADKALALRFTVHIIGDLHQPLHVGNGLDRGGNDVAVAYFGRETNLHSVWDNDLIDGEKLSYSEWTEWLARRITPEAAAAWADPNPVVWVNESAALRDLIYPEDPNLSYSYIYNNIDIVKLRLAQGGVRMAAYLNMVFEAPPAARP